jgi:type IV pilus biogenesis protein CpaD/CtpE
MLRMLRTTLLCGALPILLAGCAQTSTSGGNAVCSHWRPITWSLSDTPETVDQVKGNNARRTAWCPK